MFVPDFSAELANLALEATVALADAAGAIKEGLLVLASTTGPAVMQQMMPAELVERIGPKHAKLGERRVGNCTGPRPARGCPPTGS